jgi:hypothetical protein
MQKIIIFYLVLLCWNDLSAGKLDSFEQRMNQSTPNDKTKCYRNSNDYDGDSSVIGEILGSIISSIISGALNDEYSLDRDWGERPLPSVRFDATYQNIESDVVGYDFMTEVGSGPVAIHVDYTHYTERIPEDELDITRIYGLLRFSNNPKYEIDFGIGGLLVNGDKERSRLVFTIPVLLYPSDYIGFEFRPSFSEDIVDLDIAALGTYGAASLKLGYRWVTTFNESLAGPYIGFSLNY